MTETIIAALQRVLTAEFSQWTMVEAGILIAMLWTALCLLLAAWQGFELAVIAWAKLEQRLRN